MKNSILQPELFPLRCSNTLCRHQYDTDEFVELVKKRGIVYADCGSSIYQGFTCLKCNHTTLFVCNRTNPIVDLKGFILQPYPEIGQHCNEQLWLKRLNTQPEDPLRFFHLSAWDEDKFPDFSVEFGRISYGNDFPPLFVDENAVEGLRLSENETGEVYLRRLYPNTHFFRNVFYLAAPKQITEVDDLFVSNSDPSEEDIANKNGAIVFWCEQISGLSVRRLLTEKLMELGVLEFEEKHLNEKYLETLKYPFFEKLQSDRIVQAMKIIGWEETISNYIDWTKGVDFIIKEVLKEVPCKEKRNELNLWKERIKPGNALFVDAPMGLGKSYSIIHSLSNDRECSAVVFMPTKALCSELAGNLRIKIATQQDRDDWRLIESKGNRFNFASNDYLPKEVFFVEGITKEECLYFDEIAIRYKKKWYNKKSYCRICPKNSDNTCRFLTWVSQACKARIVVTTHSLYDFFNQNELLHSWHDDEDSSVKRTMFIVDEDLVVNNCYSPIVLKIDELRDFCSIFPEFIDENFPLHKYRKTIKNTFNALLGQIVKPETTTVIPPLNHRFKVPEDIKDKWVQSYNTLISYIPDYIDNLETPWNLLDIVEYGIKYGVVVQKYSLNSTNPNPETEKNPVVIHKIFFPNPKSYNLSETPPHVFFDGTKIHDRFIKRKLRGVKIERLHFNYKGPWTHKVYQNINTDLSASKIDIERDRVMKFLLDIFDKNGKTKKYYIHTTRAIHENYLKSFIEDYILQFPEISILLDYYGNLRGKNSAQDYDIHIMLGSFNPPDAFEIAMGLEFIQKQLLNKEPIVTLHNFWKFKESNSKRIYNTEYSVIEELAKSYRHAEQRQALARTRHIFHSVIFYIISKEPVHEYDPALPKADDNQFHNDLFPPRAQRTDVKYYEVKNAIEKYLLIPDAKKNPGKNKQRKKVSDSVISQQSGLHRGTVKKHRETLIKEGMIEMVSSRFYSIKSSYLQKK